MCYLRPVGSLGGLFFYSLILKDTFPPMTLLTFIRGLFEDMPRTSYNIA